MFKIKNYRPWHYLAFAIIVKAIFFFSFQYLKSPDTLTQGFFYIVTGDAPDYFQPANNLVEFGEHRTDSGDFSLRMPGYTPVLLVFRLFLSLKWALNLTLLTQVVLSGLSCYALAKIAEKVFHSRTIFILVFIGYTFSTYVSIWDTYILAESFSTSAIIFSIYFLLVAQERNKRWDYLWSGLFLTWSIFLRPFLFPVSFLFVCGILLTNLPKQQLKLKLISILIFILPLIIIETSWVIRNYLLTNEILFTQSRISNSDSENKKLLDMDAPIQWYVGEYCASFGGDHTYWNSKGASYWFFNESNGTGQNLFPEPLFNKDFNFNDLRGVKEKCLAYYSNNIDSLSKLTLEKEIKSTLLSSIEKYKHEEPFHYYIGSRLNHLSNFILHSGVYNLPFPSYIEQNLVQKALKGIYSMFYLCVFVVGGIASLFFIRKFFSNYIQLALILIPWYLVLLFPFIFKVHEFRFNTLAYPFFLIFLSVTIVQGYCFISKRRNTIL